MRNLKSWWCVSGSLAAALAGFGTAQEPTWSWAEVPGASAVALAVVWQHGLFDDADGEHGAARALAECRLERARAAVPSMLGSGVQVFADTTAAFVLVDGSAWAAGLRFCAVLVDDTMPIDDDLLQKAIARAALAADDAEWVFPGTVLECRARHALGTGPKARPVAGSATDLQAMTNARVRTLLAAPVGIACLGLGELPHGLRAAADAWPVHAIGRERRPEARAATSLERQALPTPATHPRIDGPFVSAAFPVTEAGATPALAVAIEVAKARAARLLRLRGREMVARAPFVAWSWLHGEPLVVFRRRGANEAAPDGARRDLEALLMDLRERPPGPAELAAAVQALQQELAGPPWSPVLVGALASSSASLPGRAVALLLGRVRGIAAADLAGVTAEAAHAAFVQTCRADLAFWDALVPKPAAPTGSGMPW